MKTYILFLLLMAGLCLPIDAKAETAIELYNGNRLYESLIQLENEKKEDHYVLLKAKIFQKLGEISKGLYYLGKSDLNAYLRNSKGMGSKAEKFIDEIRRSVKDKNHEKAFQTIKAFQKIFGNRRVNNSVAESMQYYSPKLYAAMARAYYEAAISNYLTALNSLRKKEDIDKVNALAGECWFEIAEFDNIPEYYGKAIEFFSKSNLNPEAATPSVLLVKMWFCDLKIGKKSDAQSLLNRLEKRALQDPVLRSELGIYMLKAGTNSKEGRKHVKEAYEYISGQKIDKRYLPVFRNFAALSKSNKNYSGALYAMETARDITDATRMNRNDPMDPSIALDLVGMYLYPRRYGDALRLLYDLQLFYPEAVPVWNIMKHISEKQGYGG